MKSLSPLLGIIRAFVGADSIRPRSGCRGVIAGLIRGVIAGLTRNLLPSLRGAQATKQSSLLLKFFSLLFLTTALLLTACDKPNAATTSNVKKAPNMANHNLPKPTKLEESLAFTCAYEKDAIAKLPPLNKEADQLYKHAVWLYKKNRLKQDIAVYPKVERLYRIAYAHGHYKAGNNLFNLILSAKTNAPDDISLPADIAEHFIDQGLPLGYYMMGILLSNGWGVKRDEGLAMQYFRKAADLGSPEAQYYIGDKLKSLGRIGLTIPRAIGEDMIRCAGDQGHGEAAESTAIHLKRKQQYAEAVKYFQTAIKAGTDNAYLLSKSFKAPPPDNELYYLALSKDEERASRYAKISDILEGYSYLNPNVEDVDQIVPLPPAPLPEWDGKIAWVREWEKNIPPEIPSEERIAEMAHEKGLNAGTGYPEKKGDEK